MFDAVEELVAHARFAGIEPVAGLLKILRSEGGKANGPGQRGDGGQRADGLSDRRARLPTRV
jgi:hypothetical protein